MIEYKKNGRITVEYKDNFFEIKDRDSENVFLYEPQLKLDSSYNHEDFEIYFLYNSKKISENSIFNLYADDIRIGWVFPIQSLESQEHNYAKDEVYLKFAYVVLYKLLHMIVFKNQEYADFSIMDYYSDDIHILVYNKNITRKIEGFDIYKYTVSLFSKGYSFVGEGNVFTNVESIDKNIRVRQLPVPLREISYIDILFKELVPLQETGYSKFQLLYQIIEILIGVVFKYKMQELIREIELDPDDLFEKREKLNDISTEKKRVMWLFDNFSGIPSRKSNILNDLCIQLLKDNGKKYDTRNTASNLYAVRCLIVHNLYTLDKNSRELLEDINNSFLDVILDILFTFKT